MAKDVKLSSKIQPLVCSRINEMIVMQKTNIDAIVERKLCPDVIPEYSTNTVQLFLYIGRLQQKTKRLFVIFTSSFGEKADIIVQQLRQTFLFLSLLRRFILVWLRKRLKYSDSPN